MTLKCSGEKAAERVLELYAEGLDGLSNADCEILREEVGLTDAQCKALQKTLGLGAEGKIEFEEKNALIASTFSDDKDMVDKLYSDGTGDRGLYRRAAWLCRNARLTFFGHNENGFAREAMLSELSQMDHVASLTGDSKDILLGIVEDGDQPLVVRKKAMDALVRYSSRYNEEDLERVDSAYAYFSSDYNPLVKKYFVYASYEFEGADACLAKYFNCDTKNLWIRRADDQTFEHLLAELKEGGEKGEVAKEKLIALLKDNNARCRIRSQLWSRAQREKDNSLLANLEEDLNDNPGLQEIHRVVKDAEEYLNTLPKKSIYGKRKEL